MLAVQDSSTEAAMEDTIYIQLFGEGVQVYRPVPASQIAPNVYVVSGYDVYDPDDEEWEFLPGAHVVVEERVLEGEAVLRIDGVRLD